MKLTVKVVRLSANSYRAWCPALPGCVVYGQSEYEAKVRVRRAIDGYLASLDVVLPTELERKSHSRPANRGVA